MCGGFRRGKETLHDVDMLVSFRRGNGEPGHEGFVEVKFDTGRRVYMYQVCVYARHRSTWGCRLSRQREGRTGVRLDEAGPPRLVELWVAAVVPTLMAEVVTILTAGMGRARGESFHRGFVEMSLAMVLVSAAGRLGAGAGARGASERG